MGAKNILGEHVWPDVTVIHSVESVQLDGVTLEMAGQECRVDAVAGEHAFSLHVIQENRDVRNVFAGEPCEQKLVHKNFIEPVFAACFLQKIQLILIDITLK